MGVYNLETFMKTQIQGFTNVNVISEIKQYERLNHQKPVLIFDVSAIVGYLCEQRMEILFGGCHDRYYERLNKIFMILAEIAELIFFVDGQIQNNKYLTWKKRQNYKYKQSQKIIKLIQDKKSIHEIATKNKIYANTTLSVIECLARKYGKLKYAVNQECDQEIAQFAAQHRVLAIFSDDSDFLIFAGHWRYFSMKNLNADSFQTKEYNRKTLRSALRLNEFQMQAWATCLGNDILSHVMLKSFHQRFSDKFFQIATFIRHNVSGTGAILELLTKHLFGNEKDWRLNLIHESFKFYNVLRLKEAQPNSNYDYLLDNHMLFTRNILCNAPLNFSLLFYDLEEQSHPTYYDIAIPMFQKQAGIVFAQAQLEEFKLKVYNKQSHSVNHEVHMISPIIPPFEVLPMEKIHSNDDSYDEHRLKLLAWSICWEKLKFFNLNRIPSRFMIDILSLVFLIQNRLITPKEADILLLSIKHVQEAKANNWPLPTDTLDSRAFHIAFLYTRIYTNVTRSIEVCGLRNKYEKPLLFNGFEFHALYNFYKDKDFDTNFLLGDIN